MKKLLITFIAITCVTLSMSAQLRTGILLGGGTWGNINAKANATTIKNMDIIDVNYKSSFMLGYRFRLHHNTIPGFIDLDAIVGLKNWNSTYGSSDGYGKSGMGDNNQPSPYFGAKSNYLYTSISATANYYVVDKLSVGLGVEPTVWVSKSGEENSKTFDLPLVAKIGYDFNFLEVGLTYKHSFVNSVKSDHLDSAKFSDLQFSIWIPF